MRKNFLLLFLMALLPMAGWAAPTAKIYVVPTVIEKTYGQLDPGATYGSVTESMFYVASPASADLLVSVDKIADCLKVIRVVGSEGENVGSYKYRFETDVHQNADVEAAYAEIVVQSNGDLNINKATAVAPTAPEAITGLAYNGTAQTLTGAATPAEGFEAFGIEYSIDNAEWAEELPTGTNAGEYDVYYRTKGNSNYEPSTCFTPVVVNIAKGDASLTTAATFAADLEYNKESHQLIATAAVADFGTVKYRVRYKAVGADDYGEWSGAKVNIDNDALKALHAGTYNVQVNIAGDDNVNVNANLQNVEIEVAQREVTICAAAQTISYGDAKPDGMIEYLSEKALIEGDAFAADPIFAIEDEDVTPGEYQYSITNGDALGTNDYAVTYSPDDNKSLTITKRDINAGNLGDFVIALGANPVYTGSPVVATVTSVTFKGDDLFNPTDYTYVTQGTNVADGGKVIITGQGNFMGSREVPFDIQPMPVYIKPDDANKAYGGADPELTYTIVNAPAEGEVVEGATLNGTVTLKRLEGENVGTYTISVIGYESAGAENYQPVGLNSYTAIFTINPSGNGLVLKFKDGTTNTKVYGEANPAWTINDLEYVSGLIGEDTWETIKPTLSVPTFAITSENVDDNGANNVNVTTLSSTNYPDISVEPYAFTVTARPISIEVKPQEVGYGGNLAQGIGDDLWVVNNTKSWNEQGLAGEDTKESLNVELYTDNQFATYNVEGSPYAETIKARINNNNNYVLDVEGYESTWGTLTITEGAVLALDDNNDDNYTKIYYYNNQTIPVTLKLHRSSAEIPEGTPRAWTAGNWNSLVLPFDVTVRELSNIFGYAVFNVVNPEKTVESSVQFKLEMGIENDGKILANTPILVKSNVDLPEDEDGEFFIDFGPRTIKAPAAAKFGEVINDETGYKFCGTYEDYTITASDLSGNIYFWLGNTIKPAHITSTSLNTWNIRPFSCYVDQNVANAAPELNFVYEDLNGTTAVRGISVDESINNSAAEGWYNLNGMKMQSTPTKKGVYILNGKKVVVK